MFFMYVDEVPQYLTNLFKKKTPVNFTHIALELLTFIMSLCKIGLEQNKYKM